MTNSNHIITWLQSHPLIKIGPLEELADMPPDTIRQAMKGRQHVPDKYIPGLIRILKPYGYKPKKK
jgi:hypothetical protein